MGAHTYQLPLDRGLRARATPGKAKSKLQQLVLSGGGLNPGPTEDNEGFGFDFILARILPEASAETLAVMRVSKDYPFWGVLPPLISQLCAS